MIEILGTRVIGPFYGVSLFVWSALISVTMIALALGYFLGGVLADRSRRFQLSHALMLAALSTVLVPVLARPILEITNQLGVRLGSFASALLLFGAPLTFLAMTGPFVIKLAFGRDDTVGITSGSVYAISTLGSVLGTLALGFYLLPAMGSRAIVYGIGIGLWLLAGGLSWYEFRRLGRAFRPARLIFSAAILAGVLAGAGKAAGNVGDDYRLLFQTESVYGRIQVIDDLKRGIRWMLADSSTISGMHLASGKSVLSYQSVVRKLPRFRPRVRDALLIGLGSGHLANDFTRQGLQTDIIEIDPAVARSAQDFFGFRPPGELWIGDARYQVRRIGKRYDLIVHDCFTGGSEPVHLLSLEMLEDLRARLRPGGILAVNMVGFLAGPQRAAVDAVYRTLARVFAHTMTLVSDPGVNFNDLVFVASERPIENDAAEIDYRFARWLSDHRFPLHPKEGFLITDDYNPLESLQVGKAEAYRALLIQRIGADVLLW
ncbi:MAG: hypothetical protein Kow0060_22200 [Methylohalobius crimeensis]